MPKYFCDYCDTYLTHDSPSVRKTHCSGRKHKENVKFYYQKWMEDQAQSLIDATTAAFKAGKIASNPFAPNLPRPPGGAALPPPPNLQGPHPRGQMPPHLPPGGHFPGPMPPMGGPGMPPNVMMPGMRPPLGPMMAMNPMRPPMGPMMAMGPMRQPMMVVPQPPS